MFFVVSKLAGIVFQPVTFVLLVGLFGLVLMLAGRRSGRWWMGLSVVTLCLFCWSPLAAMLLRPLEDRFPRPPADMPAPAGIIVLGGAMDEEISHSRGVLTMTDAASRLTAGVALARKYPEARLVFTGGSADLRQSQLDEARGVRDLWLSLGVPETRMTFEDDSRNTYENATMTRAMVTPKPGERWLLVTSAAHMPRSVGIFRKTGWSVVPYPVDFHTFGDDRDFKLTTNPVDAVQRLTTAFHEWVGLAAYWLTGKTDALFPAP